MCLRPLCVEFGIKHTTPGRTYVPESQGAPNSWVIRDKLTYRTGTVQSLSTAMGPAHRVAVFEGYQNYRSCMFDF